MREIPSFSSFLEKHFSIEQIITIFAIGLSASAFESALFFDDISQTYAATSGSFFGTVSLATALICLQAVNLIFASLFVVKTFPNWGKKQSLQTQSQAEHYLIAAELSRDGVCITNPDGQIVYINDMFCKYHGYDSSLALMNQNWVDLFEPEHKEQHLQKNPFELQRNMRWLGKAKGTRQDKSLYDAELNIMRFKDGSYIIITHDISQEMQAESLSAARLAAIESSKDGIVIINERGITIFINQALMDIHGIHPEDRDRYIGRHWENLHTKNGRMHLKNDIMPEFERLGSWRGENPLENKQGKIIMTELTLSRLPDGGMIGTVRDITQRKSQEKETALLKDQFHQAQKMEAVGRLAGGMAHDFNNILAAIMGYAEFLLEDLPKNSNEHKFVRNIYTAGLQARDLIDHMLAFSRRSESSHDVIDISDPFEETLKILGSTVPRSIEIQHHIDIDHPFIKGNTTQIGQTLMNLCVNSKDAMGDESGILALSLNKWDPKEPHVRAMLSQDTLPDTAGSGSAPVKIEKIGPDSDGKIQLTLGQLSDGEEYIKLTVSDTGSGIPFAVAEHIFEPFYTTKSVNEGTGLGMAMVHGVVLEHHGALFMKSQIGKGTTFEIYFPITIDDLDDDDMGIDDLDNEEKAIHGSGRILIVEDQLNVLTMMEKMLERLGYTTTSTSDPMEALDWITSGDREFDLVLTDHTMPKMTGIALAQQAYNVVPDLPFILASGYSQKKLDKAAELSINIKDVIRKPLRSNMLSEKIAHVLAAASAGRCAPNKSDEAVH